MTQGPETPDPNQQPEGSAPPPPPYEQPAQPTPPPYGQPQGGYAPPAGGFAAPNPAAPYGVHPVTGVPYSDKTKLVAGLLQILIPLGIGRFYIGDTKTGVWQLVVTILTCGIGALWPFIDGIMILATDSKDAQGRPLRTS
ncbi:TM2 domain-containing protein [Nocardioides caricicola]|uniref:TM2 domain-containing protein n=1 Tax=Nocardioides caricicola TaxID=634770 RepID=A0ABW0N8J2_9ACTN